MGVGLPLTSEGMDGVAGGKARMGREPMGLSGFGVGNRTGEFHHHAIETALDTMIASPRIETDLVIAIDLQDVRLR